MKNRFFISICWVLFSINWVIPATLDEAPPNIAELNISEKINVPPSANSGAYATFDTLFERVIGLGYRCSTKGQINRYFVPEQPRILRTKFGQEDLFD